MELQMFRPHSELVYQHVRDHLERAIAILHNDEAARPIRTQIEEAIELIFEYTYRRSDARPGRRCSTRLPALVAANDN
jgi:hypothetical protein